MRKSLPFLCIIGILLLLALTVTGTDQTVVAVEDGTEPNVIISYTKHDPIVITSNADFDSQGWPGNGTEGNPYIIEDLNITSSSVCISITDTTVYFEIRDCKLFSNESSTDAGILFDNVQHGSVVDCMVDSHSEGLLIEDSFNSTLINNTVINNTVGVDLYNSPNCSITNNTAIDNFHGYNLFWSEGSTLMNNTAAENNRGFTIHASDECIIANSTIIDNWNGFQLFESAACTVTNNTFVNNGLSIKDETVSGSSVPYWLHDISDNTVNGKALGYFKNLVAGSIDASSYGQIILANCSGVTVQDGMFNATTKGIQLGHCNQCSLKNNTATGDSDGFHLLKSVNCTLRNNSAIDNTDGFFVKNSTDCTLINNTARENAHGFWLSESSACNLTDNIITQNELNGIWILSGSENHIYHNAIWANIDYEDNINNAEDDGSSNVWDDGVSIGNYWGDYEGSENYSVAGDANSVDRYPYPIEAYFSVALDHPDDIEYELGTTGHNITWHPSDSHPDSYEIHLDDALIDSGAWDGGNISVSVEGLEVGAHNYTLTVYDDHGDSASDSVLVTVYEMVKPSIDNPPDEEYELGTTGHSITWSPADANPASYSVYENGSLVKSKTWDGSDIEFEIDGLTVGTYNYTLVVYDTSENTANDTVMVTVYDTTSPSIDTPSDFEYENGTTGHSITWSPFDLDPASYRVYRNESITESRTWNGSEIAVDVDGLDVGAYNYTIIVCDASGNTASDTVFVTVTLSTTTTTTPTSGTTPPEGFDPMLIMLIAGATLGVVAIIVIVYVLKRK